LTSFNSLLYQISRYTGDGTAHTGYRLVAIALLLETIKEIQAGENLGRNFYFLEYHPLGQACMDLLDLNPEVILQTLEDYRNGQRWEPDE